MNGCDEPFAERESVSVRVRGIMWATQPSGMTGMPSTEDGGLAQ